MSILGRKRPKLADLKPALAKVERRLFLRQSVSFGALAMLTGCDIGVDDDVEKFLWRVSRFNDKVQAALFDPNKLAPVYPESAITNPFPFNAFYGEDETPVIDGSDYQLKVSGLVTDKTPWTLARLRALPQISQVTRHICVEGWSAIGKWGGIPFRTFLQQVGADMRAKYVGFECADKYYSSIDMATALHPQTILALDYGNAELPPKYGYPLKLRVPTKLGFKNPKLIGEIFVTNDYPGGYWEDQGYNWFSGS
ncbi:MAG: molybdopterin-binding protein [Rhodospirillales bacterium]|nr:molybdopterin-binding protein [Rhodospirillales bacterium]